MQTALSYFCQKRGDEPKTVDLRNDRILDYKGFQIAQGVSSHKLIMRGVIIQETVGVGGAKSLANYLLNNGLTHLKPKDVALDYDLKFRAKAA